MKKETQEVLRLIEAERFMQDAKWGRQLHPSINPSLYAGSAKELADSALTLLGLPLEAHAKELCDHDAARGRVSWSVIAVEELVESVAAAAEHGGDSMRALEQVIQLGAVCSAWAESIIERRKRQRHAETVLAAERDTQ